MNRYDILAEWHGGSQVELEITKDDQGEWVKYEDIERILNKLDYKLCKITGQGINSTPRVEYLRKEGDLYFTAEGTGFGEGWEIKEFG